jgi:hypothetical protein
MGRQFRQYKQGLENPSSETGVPLSKFPFLVLALILAYSFAGAGKLAVFSTSATSP